MVFLERKFVQLDIKTFIPHTVKRWRMAGNSLSRKSKDRHPDKKSLFSNDLYVQEYFSLLGVRSGTNPSDRISFYPFLKDSESSLANPSRWKFFLSRQWTTDLAIILNEWSFGLTRVLISLFQHFLSQTHFSEQSESPRYILKLSSLVSQFQNTEFFVSTQVDAWQQ